MVAGIAAGGAFALTELPGWRIPAFLAAALLIQLRLLANMLDGMVAIETGKASPVGALYNEVPDRVSDAAICIGGGYAVGSLPELGYLAACVAIFVAYVRVQGKVAGAQQDFCGPMAKPQRMLLLTVVAVYCGLAPQAWQPMVSDTLAAGPIALALAVIVVGGVWTALRRLAQHSRHLAEGGALTPETREHLFGWWTAFDHPFVCWVMLAIAVVLASSGMAIQLLRRSGRMNAALYQELWLRWKSWLWLTLLMAVPILLGAAWVIAAVLVLSMLCFSEFARATGLFREKLICAVVVLGILGLIFACADNYAKLYFALAPLTVGVVAIVTIPQDRPRGYIQRTAHGRHGLFAIRLRLGLPGHACQLRSLPADAAADPGWRGDERRIRFLRWQIDRRP